MTIWFVVSAQVRNLVSSDGMSVHWCLSNWQFEMSHCDRYICPSDKHICTCHRNTKNIKTPSVFGAQLDFGAQYKTVEQSSHWHAAFITGDTSVHIPIANAERCWNSCMFSTEFSQRFVGVYAPFDSIIVFNPSPAGSRQNYNVAVHVDFVTA